LDDFFSGMPEYYGGAINGPLRAVGFGYKQKETDVLIARNRDRNRPPRLALNHIEANKILPFSLSLNTGKLSLDECVTEVIRHFNEH